MCRTIRCLLIAHCRISRVYEEQLALQPLSVYNGKTVHNQSKQQKRKKKTVLWTECLSKAEQLILCKIVHIILSKMSPISFTTKAGVWKEGWCVRTESSKPLACMEMNHEHWLTSLCLPSMWLCTHSVLACLTVPCAQCSIWGQIFLGVFLNPMFISLKRRAHS